MKETLNEVVENDDTKIAEQISEALQTTKPEAEADSQPSTADSQSSTPAIDVDALARALRDAEERGYQRAIAEAENARRAQHQRTFAMPASDPTPPTSSPTILSSLKPGFWDR